MLVPPSIWSLGVIHFLQYHGEANKSTVQIKSGCESVCYVVLGFTLQIRLRVKWNVCHVFS